MINLVLKAFERFRTVTTPTLYLTLVIDKTETFVATWNQFKAQKYELLRQAFQTFPFNCQTFNSFVFLLVCLRLACLFFYYLLRWFTVNYP